MREAIPAFGALIRADSPVQDGVIYGLIYDVALEDDPFVRHRFELTIDGVSTVIEADDSYVIPGGTLHSYHVLEDALAVEVFSPPREDYR